MHFLMLSSLPCCPTVLTKYPSDQNSPPHSFFFTSGHQAKISRAVMLLMICTIFFALYIGTDCTESGPFADLQASLFQFFVYRCAKHHSSILGWKNNMIQK